MSAGEAAKDDKAPRTARGERTRRALLSAAGAEFGEKGFHDGSISGITRRAGTALASEIGLMKALKHTMDPRGILNPGRVF